MMKLGKISIILIYLVSLHTFAFAEQSEDITITVSVDGIAPDGSIVINDDAAYCNSTSVTLTLSATDSNGVDQMQFSNDGVTWSAPEPYAATKKWTLSSGEGEKTVYVKFKDIVGNWSNPISDSIILDTSQPRVARLANVIDRNNLEIIFSEKIIGGTSPENYTIIPSLGDVIVTYQQKSTYRLQTFEAQLSQQTYSVTVSGVTDLAGNTIDPVFDTATFVGGTTGGISLITSMIGEAEYDYFGYSVASAGDVNGDGFVDVIVGADRNDDAGANAGKAYIYFGGPSMDSIADVTMTGENAYDRFGRSVASAGDVNGDGFDDVIIGAPASGLYSGKVYIYFGGSSMDVIADVTMVGEADYDWFGDSVSSAGDLNGDGFSDVIVGSESNNDGGEYAGKVYIYFGGSSMDAIADVTMVGAEYDGLGHCVASAGDINGDGFKDVIVGAPFNLTDGLELGKAYIYFGDSSMDNTADVTMVGEADGDWFSCSVASAGDVNGDSFDDVIIGADDNDEVAKNSGKAYIYFGGSSMDSIVDITMAGEADYNWFGGSVASAGDVNGDGFADVVIGAQGNDAGGESSGKAYFYFGGSSMDNTADVTMIGEAADDSFGYSVATAGNINGDSLADVIVGAIGNDEGGKGAGKAYVYGGVPDTTNPRLLPDAFVLNEYNVEVTYSEEVKYATDASNYSIEPNLGEITVTDMGLDTYRLTTSLAQVKGTLYPITVNNVTDLVDNIIDPEHNQATFLGYDPTIPTVDSFEVMDMDTGSKIYTNEATVSVSMTESDPGGDNIIKWLINESSTRPSPGDFALAQRPTQYIITGGPGPKTIYAWVMDEYKNVSKLSSSSQVMITLDITPPETPTVIDDGIYTSSLTQLHASWSANDPESGVVGYQYAIGTTRGSTDVVSWKSAGQATEATETGLSLVQGQTYYFAVKTKNGAGSWSQEGTSDGIIVNQSLPEITSISPADGSPYYQGDTVNISASASDADGNPLEYRFSITSEVKQSWSTNSTYDWLIPESNYGLKIIKVEVRDPFQGVDEATVEIYIFVSPKRTPAH